MVVAGIEDMTEGLSEGMSYWDVQKWSVDALRGRVVRGGVGCFEPDRSVVGPDGLFSPPRCCSCAAFSTIVSYIVARGTKRKQDSPVHS